MLTNRCEKDFEKWACNNGYCVMSESHGLSYDYSESWYDLPFSMQYGVLIDFFDSVGILMVDGYYGYRIVVPEEIKINQKTKTRQEAREQVILKANEIYNSKENINNKTL